MFFFGGISCKTMANTVIVLLSFTLIVAHAAVISDSDWLVWKTYHSKSYQDDNEEHMRYIIWKENLKYIINHAQENHSYVLAMNQFGDLTTKEFVILVNGYHPGKKLEKSEASTFLPPSNTKLPPSVDWRPKGYVTKVKNQQQCGSCWAFSTTGSLEGQHFKKTGQLVSLSEQNLVDCSSSFGNSGCDGGLMDNAFKYIKANGGIDTEASYPYQAEDEQCRFNKSNVGADDTGFVDIPKGSEDKLQIAVATIGPISVAIDASHQSFQFYHKGVYDEPTCSSVQLDHGVLVVGYGTSDSGQKYWIVKNSWAASWGDEGYINMSRDKNNQCGIATSASYPLV